jgi:hypothetical protein
MDFLLKFASVCCVCCLLAGCGASHLSSNREGEGNVAAAFKVLRTRSEHLPPRLAEHIARLLKASEKARPVNTQLVRTPGGSIWVFLTGDRMCLVQANFGSISCSKKRLARSQGVVLGTFKPPSKEVPYLHQFLVLGVMPDDVRYVSATLGRHSHQRHIRRPVQGNVFAIAAQRPVLVRRLGRR